MGYALELVAATVPPEVPHQVGTPLIGTPDEHLLADSSPVTVTAPAPPTWPTCATSMPGAPGPTSG
jgi:hypothetical protein